MAENNGNTGIAFVVGILVVVVAALAYFLFAGGDVANKPDITIELPDTGGNAN